MLQPPANKILFEVFLNCCQGLNDSQEQKYVCTECVLKLRENFESLRSLFLHVCALYIVYFYEVEKIRVG